MRIQRGALALAGAAVLAIGPGAASSAATARTWTVSPGGAITASGTATLDDTTTHTNAKCVTAKMSGTFKSGSGLPGAGIESIATATYSGCSIAMPPHVTARGLPWHLNLVSYDAATGVSRGTIRNLQISVTAPGCSAVVNGTSGTAADGVVAVTYTNQTGRLRIRAAGGNLHWYQVSGCFGLINDGDLATMAASYGLTPRQVITSP